MHEPKGSILPITGPRRFIIDLVHFARRVPSTPVSRLVNTPRYVPPRNQIVSPACTATGCVKAVTRSHGFAEVPSPLEEPVGAT